jgi:SAM-dependent methyltransferase
LATTEAQMQAIQEAKDIDAGVDTRTKKEEDGFNLKDVAMFGAEMLPGVGEAIALKRTSDALDEKDYVGAGIEATAGLLGLIPGVGDAAGKVFRASANALRTPKWFKETKVDTNLTPDSSRKTQITTTTPTYRKVRDLLPEGKTLDFGSGKGVGAKDVGFDTYEPFPDADFTPNYSSSKDIPNESYENVTSLNVLNVVKPEKRTEIVTDIGRILKPGGTAIITTRGADVFGNAKNPVKGVLGDEPGSVITSAGTYQKGFTQAELKEYVQETLGEGFEVVNISGAGQAGVKITKTKPVSYDVDNPIFHATKKDFSEIDLVPVKGDIGFHVGTSKQADFRLPYLPKGATALQRKGYLEDAEGARFLKLALREDLKPLRVPDIGQFKQPDNWLGQIAVDTDDVHIIRYLNQEPEDAALLASAPKVEIDGKTFRMQPDVRRTKMPPEVWTDLVKAAYRNKVLTQGSSTSPTSIARKADKQISKMRWFTDLKDVLNKHGYDSLVYRNEYEGAFDMADSYMLTEADQVKNVFGGMTPGDPDLNKNRGGLMMQKGGAVPMKEQMELFADGGLEQDGGTTDPISGNKVPPGSAQEEVRDDIPAQLSEGEFVFPADVVRYIGLEKLMRMRQEAKMGLKLMEEMGQMGNADEATIPDDLPFTVTDLIIVDDGEDVDKEENKEYNIGGVVFGNNPTTGVTYQAPQFQAGQTQVGMAASPVQMAPIARPEQQATPVYQPPQTLPTASEFIAPPEGTAPTTITIVNEETGEERVITFIPGATEIPEGFVRKEDYVPKEVVPETPTTTVETATVREEESDGDEERRRQEEAMYGPGGGRLGFKDAGKDGKDLIFGVSFDMPEGFMPGAMGALGTGFGLLSGKPLPADVTVNFKRGEIEFSMSGTEYNDLKSAIKEFGSGSDEAKAKLNEYGLEQAVLEKRQRDFMEAQAEKMAKEARQSELAKAREIADERRRKAAVEAALEKQRQEAIAAAERERAYLASVGDYERDDDSDDPGGFTVTDASGQEYRTDSSGTAGAFTGGEVGMEDEYDFNTGGLAGKKKPKAKKKMKRGGLASKK